MNFIALCLLSFTLALLGRVEAAPEQNISAELNGKLVALRGKSAPFPTPRPTCRR